MLLFLHPPFLSDFHICQANRPPAKLNLLTCQVKHNPEEKRSFDLISRKFNPLFSLAIARFVTVVYLPAPTSY